MPTSQNQKMKLVYLMKILQERTDENHSLTVQELIIALNEYGVEAERKSIYSDMESLRQYGLNIETRKSKKFGYYIASRQFELPELKLLVDAVQSSRFITQRKSNMLIQKLSSLTSSHQAKELSRQVVTANRPKAINESVYYNIDSIHTAINDGKKVSFKYFDYDLRKARAYRKAGESYTQTPLALCWNDDKYYLICYSSKYDSIINFRIDRMSGVSVCEENADRFYKKNFNVSEYVRQTFGMYGGETVSARLRFDKMSVNSVLDHFGADIKLNIAGDCFEIDIDISPSPVFLSWIAQFGANAEIISPESMRVAMRELITELNEKYNRD